MTPTTTHTRLSDEVMAKVIESQMGWLDATYSESGLFTYRCVFTEDPRDHTDAALELLAFLRAGYLNRVQLTEGGSHWLVYTKRGTAAIPISGPEFCYAVVNLAAKVLGVEGGE